MQQKAVLLDHRVGADKQSGWHSKAESLRDLEIDDKLHFCDLLYRQVGRSFALENATGVDTSLPPSIKKIRSITHKTAGFGKLAERIERWHRTAVKDAKAE
jgi:hypothetical protein